MTVCFVDKSSGRDSLLDSFESGRVSSDLGSVSRLVSFSETSGRQQECLSGSFEQKRISCSNRVDSGSQCSPEDLVDLGKTSGAFVCNEVQRKTSSLCLSNSRQSSLGNRCDGDLLGQSVSICLPSNCNVVSVPSEGQVQFSKDHPDSSMVANSSWFMLAKHLLHSNTSSVESEGRRPVESLSSRDSSSQSSRLAFMRGKLQK